MFKHTYCFADMLSTCTFHQFETHKCIESSKRRLILSALGNILYICLLCEFKKENTKEDH